MDNGIERRPFTSVVNEAIGQFASLMRLDLRLLQAEMKGKASTIVSSGACGLAAVAFLILASFALVQFLILAMIYAGISAMLACLVVSLVMLGAGVLSLYLAKRALVGWTLTPVETVNQVAQRSGRLEAGDTLWHHTTMTSARSWRKVGSNGRPSLHLSVR